MCHTRGGLKNALICNDPSGFRIFGPQAPICGSETIVRIKDDIARKGITFFSAVDQQALAAKAGIELPPSTLLSFGNPALGSQFITAKGEAGLDWPVRLLVQQDDRGNVWAIYTDFGYIAKRHGITNRDAQFTMASGVVQSITSTVKAN